MAAQQPRVLSAPFPPPPPFYKHFTKANRARLRGIEKESSREDGVVDDRPLPDELAYLVPPEPPADGRWRSFGAQHDLSAPEQSLAEAGIPQLYGSLHSDDANKVDDSITIALDAPPSSPTQDIITLTRAILLNFLSLIQLLAADPTQADAKVADLQNLFYNVHHLINLYRPHQARESLIAMLEEQIQRKRALVERVRVVKERVGKVLGEVQALTAVAGQAGGDGTAISAKAEPTATSTPLHMDGVTNDVHRRQQKQKDAWTRLQLAV